MDSRSFCSSIETPLPASTLVLGRSIADAARRLQANPISFEVQRVSEALGLHSHQLEQALAEEGLLGQSRN